MADFSRTGPSIADMGSQAGSSLARAFLNPNNYTEGVGQAASQMREAAKDPGKAIFGIIDLPEALGNTIKGGLQTVSDTMRSWDSLAPSQRQEWMDNLANHGVQAVVREGTIWLTVKTAGKTVDFVFTEVRKGKWGLSRIESGRAVIQVERSVESTSSERMLESGATKTPGGEPTTITLEKRYVSDRGKIREVYDVPRKKVTGTADEAASILKGGSCFSPETEVQTESGGKSIGELKEGDRVWSRDEKTGKSALKPIQQIFRRLVPLMVVLSVGGGEIRTTPEHPFFVAERGWVDVRDLRVGDVLETLEGGHLRLEGKTVLQGVFPVCNIEVEDFHTYFVSGLGILVHNKAMRAPGSAATESVELKPYGGPGGGHHVPAKKAFEGAQGYDMNEALAIPNDTMAKLKLEHPSITGAQASGYRQFAKTGQELTWDVIESIETKALMKGGLSAEEAAATVKKAIEALKSRGVTGPTKIPWGG